MRVEVLDPRKEWPEEYGHLEKVSTSKRGGIVISFSSDPNKTEECLALRAFRRDSMAVMSNPPPGVIIRIVTETYYGNLLKWQFTLIFQIYSQDSEESPIEWFKTAADLLAMFGRYFVPASLTPEMGAHKFRSC